MRTQFGSALSKTLDQIDLSQAALANELEISPARLNKIINGTLTEVKARPTPEMLGKIYLAILPRDKHLAIGLLAAHFADNIKRAGISGADTPKLCGLCTHWETDPKDPSKGGCKLQKDVPHKETCDCFSLGEL